MAALAWSKGPSKHVKSPEGVVNSSGKLKWNMRPAWLAGGGYGDRRHRPMGKAYSMTLCMKLKPYGLQSTAGRTMAPIDNKCAAIHDKCAARANNRERARERQTERDGAPCECEGDGAMAKG